MNLSTFLKLEIKNLVRSRSFVAALVAILAAGGYAMFHGKNIIAGQNAIIDQIPTFQAEHTAKQLELGKADLGNFLYYHRFSTIHYPSAWAAFSIGQRDVNPYIVKVGMLTLEGQLYDSEISNPTNLLYGNFDLAFVIVFLFPLLIIAFTHNLISAEQESGVWSLLRSQPVSLGKILMWRSLIRFAITLSLCLGLITAGALYFQAPFDDRFLYVLIVSVCYLVFWFALAAFVISLNQSSTVNAISLLGSWIILTILCPALLNLVISTALPVTESFDVTVKQREGYHQKWDRSKAETMEKFYEIYPEYRAFPIPEDKFSWGWYYAMQHSGDLEAESSTEQYVSKLESRDRWTECASLFIPTISSQLAFNSLSGNDLRNHILYLDSVRTSHTRIREHFYPLIFREAKSSEIDWQGMPRHAFAGDEIPAAFPTGTASVLICAILFGIFAWWNLRASLR